MSCQTDIPIKDIADIVGEDFIPKEGGKGTGTTLIDPRIRGDVALDKTAKESLCEALNPCIDEALTPLENEINEVDKKADDAASAAQDANNAADNAMSEAQAAGDAANAATEAAQSAQQTALNKSVAQVIAEDDKRTIVLQDGTKIPFFVTDQTVPVEPLYQDEKVVGFGVKGDNVVITMIDGTEHDLTRQEFADWLAAQDTPLATDNELAEAIAQGTGDLQEQINALNQGLDSLQAQIDAFDPDQAMLFIREGKLVLRNEDNTEHEVPLTDLIPLSDDAGQLIEMREDGIYYGIEAKKEVAVLYVDYEDGDNSNDGTEESPLKTIDEAFRRAPENKNSTILLRAVDSLDRPMIHEMNVNEFAKGGATRTIGSYGQPYFPDGLAQALWSKGGYLTTSLSEEHIRPIVKPVWQEVFDGTKQVAPYFGGDKISTIQFFGVRLDLSRVIGGLGIFNNQFIRGNGNFAFTGCEIAVYDNSTPSTLFYFPGSGSSPEIKLSRTKWIDGDTGEEIIPNKTLVNLDGSTGTIICNDDVWGPTRQSALDAVKAEYPEFADITITPFSGNSRDVFSTPGKVSGVVRSSLGVPLNLTSNVEIP